MIQLPPGQSPGRGRARALPLALTLLLAACGGSNGESPMASMQNASLSLFNSVASAIDGPETALTPVRAYASSAERADLDAPAAIDHNNGTRWGSRFTDAEYIVLDFGQTRTITRVNIQWEAAHAREYLLQVSENGSDWTTIKTVTDSQGGTEDLTGFAGQGRYLRMQGVKRAGGYGYSIEEIQAFTGTPAAAPSPTPAPGADPLPVDLTKPGVVVKPVAATSSTPENGGMAAGMAIDGKPGTRWSSKPEDGAWIQFDFGQRVALGYLKLSWEASYGKAYTLMTSDDGEQWTQLRHVGTGKGGTEEFFNLNATARHVRLQGVARASQYGYSLFEVEFKSPGSDNTIPEAPTSAVRYPANGNGWTPLPGAAQPMETLQFSLPDGTLVTRFGARGLARHGRERGEEWNEIGYGPNETINPATGLPQDKGPGNYLTFVEQYFQNRTWGVEIIDNSRVAGVTKPQLTVNQYTTVDFLSGGIAFFRAFDRPGVTGYGWMSPGELVDRDVKECAPTPYPAAGRLSGANGINNGCTLLIKNYPGHGEIDSEGFPTGRSVNARALVQGDLIEVSPSMFATKAAMQAKGDNGGVRYYSAEWTYVVGQGLRPWYGVKPRLFGVPLPEETLSGGMGSVSYNYTDNGLFMFQQPHNHVGMQNMQRFVEGRRLLHTNFTTGDHNENGNDRYQAAVGLQGQRFNQSACIGCHVNNGRSPAPAAINQRLDAMAVRVARTGTDGQLMPHPVYGTAIQMNGYSSNGTPQNWGTGVRVASFETRTVTLADGTAVELRKPKLAYDGPAPQIVSLRSAQPMIGTGLLEAIPEADILARVRSAPDGDGVKGTANFVFDPESGAVRLGRFGWKASKATLRHQTASALLTDMSVTSSIYPNRSCDANPAGCKTATRQKGITDAELQLMTNYLSLLAVPAQRSLESGFPKGVAPLEEHIVNTTQVAAGAKLFDTLRCVACHTSSMKTGSNHLFAELRDQTIRPYTNMLLHDMGPGLADGYSEGQATGSMWRTAPLWGIGYTEKVMGKDGQVGYLHDGRARNLTEAILWHDGEGAASRVRFEKLPKQERESLLAFLRSL